MKVEKMSSTPECVTKTPEIEALKEVYRIYPNTEKDNFDSKLNPNLGEVAVKGGSDEALNHCREVLGEKKPTDPVGSVKEIGNRLTDLRKTKANEVQ